MESALLLGNGLNRLAGEVDLAGLMSCLSAGQGKNYKSLSSWPLEFERIYAERNKGQANGETVSKSCLKQQIRAWLTENLSSINGWPLLPEFTSLPVKHILTTNYDYNIEKAVNPQI